MNIEITIDSMIEHTERSIADYERHLAWAYEQVKKTKESIEHQREHLAWLKNQKEIREAAK